MWKKITDCPFKCKKFELLLISILTIFISRLHWIIKRYLKSFHLPLINRQTSVFPPARPTPTKHTDFHFQVPLFLSTTSPLQFPQKTDLRKGKSRRRRRWKRSVVWLLWRLISVTHHNLQPSSTPSSVSPPSPTHPHSIPWLIPMSTLPTCRSSPSAPHSDNSMCQPASVYYVNTWLRLAREHGKCIRSTIAHRAMGLKYKTPVHSCSLNEDDNWDNLLLYPPMTVQKQWCFNSKNHTQ